MKRQAEIPEPAHAAKQHRTERAAHRRKQCKGPSTQPAKLIDADPTEQTARTMKPSVRDISLYVRRKHVITDTHSLQRGKPIAFFCLPSCAKPAGVMTSKAGHVSTSIATPRRRASVRGSALAAQVRNPFLGLRLFHAAWFLGPVLG